MTTTPRRRWLMAMLLVFILVGFSACRNKRPDTVLSNSEMENVLYDYHLAKAMGDELPGVEPYMRVAYIEAALAKHGLTQEDFDSSMVWYTRHPAILSDIYDKVSERLKVQRDAVNNLLAMKNQKPGESAEGDSVDVWPWQRNYRISGAPLDNKRTFTLESDANFQERDTLRWIVRYHLLGQAPDSLHSPVAALQVAYDLNDTVISAVHRITHDGFDTLTLHADTLGFIREVRGFIYCPTRSEDQAYGLLADHIRLMRFHSTDSLTWDNPEAPADEAQSIEEDNKASDSKTPAHPAIQTTRQTNRARPNANSNEGITSPAASPSKSAKKPSTGSKKSSSTKKKKSSSGSKKSTGTRKSSTKPSTSTKKSSTGTVRSSEGGTRTGKSTIKSTSDEMSVEK